MSRQQRHVARCVSVAVALSVCLLLLLPGVVLHPAEAQPTVTQSFTLREFGLAPRDGTWALYQFPGVFPFAPTVGPLPFVGRQPGTLFFPGNPPFVPPSGVPPSPFPFPPPLNNLGGSFDVVGICERTGFASGVFRGEGTGFGDLVAFTLGWPFVFVPQPVPPPPRPILSLCDPDAQFTAWFAFGNSLNNSPLLARRFFARDLVPVSSPPLPGVLPSCPNPDLLEVHPEGVFFLGLRSAERQVVDPICVDRDPNYPIRVGNVLICARQFPWLDENGVNIASQAIRSCQFYRTCSNQTIGPVAMPSIPFPLNCGIMAGAPVNLTVPPGPLPTGPGVSDPPSPPSPVGTGSVTVRVNNADNGNLISGASVTQQTEGGPTQTTGGDGTTTFTSVPAGVEIDFSASAPGFVDRSSRLTPIADGNVEITISLTTPVPGGRIVLNWGANPRDLDSHLTGPAQGGGGFHVFFGNRSGGAGSGANLRFDVTNGRGPETIDVFEVHPGLYRYSVHHFSGSETICSTANQIAVNVTVGAQQALTFQPPSDGCVDGANNVWTVFEFDGQRVIECKQGGCTAPLFYSSGASGVRGSSTAEGDAALGTLPPK